MKGTMQQRGLQYGNVRRLFLLHKTRMLMTCVPLPLPSIASHPLLRHLAIILRFGSTPPIAGFGSAAESRWIEVNHQPPEPRWFRGFSFLLSVIPGNGCHFGE